MYKLAADPIEEGRIWANAVHIVQAKPDAEPLMTIKTTISYTSRNKLKLMAWSVGRSQFRKPRIHQKFPHVPFPGWRPLHAARNIICQ